MKPSFIIKKAALADLHEIADYTRKTWGGEQEAVYMKGLFACFERIARHETSNRDLSGITAGCFTHKISHHLIVFHWLHDGRPEIIRVLHEKMDISVHLVKSTTTPDPLP
jgi:toxin ParE1/3/4